MWYLHPRYLAGFLFLVFGGLCAQEQKPLLINEEFINTPLETALSKIRDQYQVPLIYQTEDIPQVLIRQRFIDTPLEKALQILLTGVPLSYRIEKGGRIVIYKDMKKALGDLLNQEGVEISGTLCDSALKTPLEGISVQLELFSIRTVSGIGGYFLLKNVPPGEHRIFFSGEGYRNDTLMISAGNMSLSLDTLWMKPLPRKREKLVSFQHRIPDTTSTLPCAYRISSEDIQNKPTLADPDLFYAMQSIPGFNTRSDVQRDVSLYGGHPQTPIRLNGAMLYLPYHFFGQLSAVPSRIIDRIDVYGNMMPASLPNTGHTLTDLQTRNRSDRIFSGSANFSLLTVQTTFESQIQDKVHLLFSGRRNYLDQLTTLAKNFESKLDILPTYIFYDLYGQGTYRINDAIESGLFVFYSRDRFSGKMKNKQYDEDGARNNNPPLFLEYSEIKHGGLNWGNQLIGGFVRANPYPNWTTRLAYYQSFADIQAFSKHYYRHTQRASPDIRRMVDSLNQLGDPDRIRLANHITDRTVQWSNELKPHSRHHLLFGVDFSALNLDYGWDAPPIDKKNSYEKNKFVQIFYDNPSDTFDYRKKGYLLAIYAEDIWPIHKKWIIRPGFRLEHFAGSKQGWFFSPRVSVRFQATQALAFKTAGGISYQPLFTSLDQGSVQLFPLPFYPENLSVPRTLHASLGTELRFLKYLKWSTDWYYQSLSRIKKNYTSGVHSPDWIAGKGQSLGFLTTLSGSYRWVGFLLSYQAADYRKTFRQQTYYDYADRRHQFESAVYLHAPGNLMLDIHWKIASGQAYRPVNYYSRMHEFNPDNGAIESSGEGFLSYRDTDHLNIYSRLPVYHRMDISFIKTFRTKGSFAFRLFIHVLNVYNRKNPIVYEDQMKFVKQNQTRYTYALKSKPYGIPVLPSVGMGFEF